MNISASNAWALSRSSTVAAESGEAGACNVGESDNRRTCLPSAATLPNAGRSGMQRMLKLSAEPRAANLEQAVHRLNTLFNPSKTQREHNLKQSAETIDFYLQNNCFREPVPNEVRNHMVVLDSMILALHQAQPFGRGNILKRHDPLSATPGNINVVGTLDKFSLRLLAQISWHLISPSNSDPMSACIKAAAVGILTGASACGISGRSLMMLVANHYEKQGLHDSVWMQMFSKPDLPAGDGVIEVDHEYIIMHFQEQSGRTHRIQLDPWADKNRVILEEHGQYKHAREGDRVTPDMATNLDIQGRVKEHMVYVSDNVLEQAGMQQRYHDAFNPVSAMLRNEEASKERHGVREPLDVMVDAPVDMAKPRVEGLNVRRQSLVAAAFSPLLSRT